MEKNEENKIEKIKIKTQIIDDDKELVEHKESSDWLEPEGKLPIDLYKTKDHLIIQTIIAGVNPKNLDISIEKDIVDIKGFRYEPCKITEEKNYFCEECFWGIFSRKIILPEEVETNKAKATMKSGILTIEIPLTATKRKKKIAIN